MGPERCLRNSRRNEREVAGDLATREGCSSLEGAYDRACGARTITNAHEILPATVATPSKECAYRPVAR